MQPTSYKIALHLQKSADCAHCILQLYTAVVVSTAIYASETWKSTRTIQNKLDVFHQRKLEKDHWSHMERQGIKRRSIARTGQRRLQDIVGERRFRFAGHVMRMAPKRPARRAIEWTPADHHHHHVACPEVDVAVPTSLIHACRFCARW